jgi:hypothetical protein
MLPMVLALPIWLVVFIVLYALAALYVSIKYREVRKFLAGAFFVSSGTCWYLWVAGVSLPVGLPNGAADLLGVSSHQRIESRQLTAEAL